MVELTKTPPKLELTTILITVVLPFLSGAAALSHELLWTRRLIDVLGATDAVIGRVLGIFFLGLSLGGFFASYRPAKKGKAINRLIRSEFYIGILTIPAIFLPFWSDWIWASLGTEMLAQWPGSLAKFLIVAGVVLPPAIAMGLTLPFFIRTITDLSWKVGSIGIWIYAINTFGGVFGLLFTTSFLIEKLGAQKTMILIAGINFAIGMTAWFLKPSIQNRYGESGEDRGTPPEKVDTNSAADPSFSRSYSRGKLLFLAFISGFLVLALEVLLLRLISLVVPSSYHTTSALLANVILVLAVSSTLVSFFNSNSRTIDWSGKGLMIAGLMCASVFMAICPIIVFHWTDQLMSVVYLEGLNGRTIESITHYWLLVFWLVAAAGGLALLFSGFIFPSLLTQSSMNDPAGNKTGLLLAANGVGGLIGSEFTNFTIIYTGIYQGFSVIALLALVAGSVLLFQMNRRRAIASTLVALGLILTAQSYNIGLPYFSPRTKTKFEVQATHFGREGVLLVVEYPDKSKGILANSQYLLGSSGVASDQRRQLLLPWIIAPQSKSVCSLGLATGISASGLENLTAPPPVTAVELSAAVDQLSRTYFRNETQGFFKRSENKVVIEDARVFMAASENQFDLIVGDLYRPHGMGEARLFTLEHFRNVRKALTHEGTYCQWLPLYQLNEENFLTIAATFQRVFPHTLLMYGNNDSRYPVIGMIGRKDKRDWNPQQLLESFQNIPDQQLNRDPQLKSAPFMIVGVLNPLTALDSGINTLDNLKVEISAGNSWILRDIRQNRSGSSQNEYLSGENARDFHRRLKKMTSSVFSKAEMQGFKETQDEKLKPASSD